MHVKTMEGLIGARMNVALAGTPLKVFKEAEGRGDTATMERAMGYVNECSEKAEEYQAKADKGMKKDAEEVKAKAEAERENAIQKRKEEREELEKRIEESRDTNADILEISEDGKALSKEQRDFEYVDPDGGMDREKPAVAGEAEPVTYTETGEISRDLPESGENISVSV